MKYPVAREIVQQTWCNLPQKRVFFEGVNSLRPTLCIHVECCAFTFFSHRMFWHLHDALRKATEYSYGLLNVWPRCAFNVHAPKVLGCDVVAKGHMILTKPINCTGVETYTILFPATLTNTCLECDLCWFLIVMRSPSAHMNLTKTELREKIKPGCLSSTTCHYMKINYDFGNSCNQFLSMASRKHCFDI